MNVPKNVTPLGLIAIFMALSEIVVTVGVIYTSGIVQLILTIFATLFPFGTAAAFFVILWKKHHVLYPPESYQNMELANMQLFIRRFVDVDHSGDLEGKSIEIDPSPLMKTAVGRLALPIRVMTTVSDLLDLIWLSVLAENDVPGGTYDMEWVLRDRETKRIFSDMGSQWARKKRFRRDSRSLESVGIRPGAKLELIRPPTA
jgi:hypothetical protein